MIGCVTPYDREPSEKDCVNCGEFAGHRESERHIASKSIGLCPTCAKSFLTWDLENLTCAIETLGCGIMDLMESDIPESAHFATTIKAQLDKIESDLVAYRDMVKAKLEAL